MSLVRPHRLELYRWAVQHPEAEVHFLLKTFAHHRAGRWATRLKEDFAGTAAVSAAWVAFDEQHRALAVESDGSTRRWAQRRWSPELGARAEDLHFLQADACRVIAPRVEVVAALNFSVFIYHDRDTLRRYFRAARRSLLPRGILVIDTYGGPGALRPLQRSRRIRPPRQSGLSPFTYTWEQRQYDPYSGKTDCRIHFTLASGRTMPNAFRYDWRVWSLPELREVMAEAGFARVQVWADRYQPRLGRSDGVYRPVDKIQPREDWVAYLVGLR